MIQHDDTDLPLPDPDRLDRYHRQQLSAMLDGELLPDQARFMLRRLQHDARLAEGWERWQVYGDMLRGQHAAMLPADFSSRVATAIAAGVQADPPAPAVAPRSRLLRWGGGGALAASVAMAALLVTRQPGIEPLAVPEPAVPAVAVLPAAEPVPVPAADGAPVSPVSPRDAGVALAAIEVLPPAAPRSGSSRRAAGTPVPVRAPALDVPDQAAVTVLAAQPVARGIGDDPFAALPMEMVARPWPRAGLQAGTGPAHAVGLGMVAADPAAISFSRSFHPFEPRRELLPPALTGAMAMPVVVPAAADVQNTTAADAGVPPPEAPPVDEDPR